MIAAVAGLAFGLITVSVGLLARHEERAYSRQMESAAARERAREL